MQNAQHGTITELLFQVFLFFLVLQMMKCEREADRRVHLLIMASLSYSFEKKNKKKTKLAVLTCFLLHL